MSTEDLRATPVSSWVDLDGPTHVVDFGGPDDPAAPVVVCVHGLGGSHVNWTAVAPLLAARCRVRALDLAGHGRTQAGRRGTDVHSNRVLLDRFLREVTGTPVILVGNSMGGLITLLQAYTAPETVAGIVLVNPALPRPRGSRPDPRVAASFLAYALPGVGERYLARRRRLLSPERLVADTLALCCVDPTRVPRHVVEAQIALARERASYPDLDQAYLGAARSIVRLMARPQRYLRAIAEAPQPALLLFGEHDRLVPIAAGRAVAARRRDWRFEVHPDVGHVPQLEDPEWTAATILDWLAREGSGAAAAANGSRPGPTPLRA